MRKHAKSSMRTTTGAEFFGNPNLPYYNRKNLRKEMDHYADDTD